MTEKELSHLTKLIKEVSLSPDADEKIALILKMASESITEDKIKGLVDKDDKRKVKSGILKFSKKEIDKMPTSLKNLFAHNDMIVRYLECETSKERLGKDVVVRRIPFTPVFRRVEKFVDFAKAKATNPRTIATTLKRLFPEHHPHELRYTYITRVKEAGVNQELVMLWDGHSFDKDVKTSAVDRGYTTYSEEYILSEANKVDYTF